MNDFFRRGWWCLVVCFSLTAMGVNAEVNVIPKPLHVEELKGSFTLNEKTVIVCDKENQETAKLFADRVKKSTGWDLKIQKESIAQNVISLALGKIEGGKEAYQLEVSAEKVTISGGGTAGVFYGTQTLLQLFPKQIFSPVKVAGLAWEAPCVEIKDAPRFKWRGMHMDVARHFMPKEFVMKFIDVMAVHKMNNFHWHLTEDQGWRIEIKKYPKLTTVGSIRKQTVIHPENRVPGGPKYDGKPHGGFYTQDDIREIVEYARKRHVNIMPEIEMPGHSQAALTAYPEFGCTGDKLELKCEPGVSKHLYNVDEKTFTFLQDILTEVMDLFPGKYIHIGGDEAPKAQWKASPVAQAKIKELGLKDENELQSWFINRMGKFLSENGRQLVGWQEIMHGGTPEGAVVMPWMNLQSGIQSANEGHDIVIATTYPFYFDSKQSKDPNEPISLMGGPFTMKWCYNYNMSLPKILPEKQKHVLGVQGQLWSEYMATPKVMEYQAFPRTIAVAELGWTSKERRDFDDFQKRLYHHSERLDHLDVTHRYIDPLPVVHWDSGSIKETCKSIDVTKEIRQHKSGAYGVKIEQIKGKQVVRINSVSLFKDGVEVALDKRFSFIATKNKKQIYRFALPDFDEKSKYTLHVDAEADSKGSSIGTVTLLEGPSLEAFNMKHYALGVHPVAHWGANELNGVTRRIDLQGMVEKDGEYELELRLQNNGVVKVKKMSLLQGGKVLPLEKIALDRFTLKGADPAKVQILEIALEGKDSEGEIYFKKVNKLTRDGAKGRWTRENMRREFMPAELDVTDLMSQPGEYEVTFNYRGGGNALKIESAELLCNGQSIAVDKHAGSSGGNKKNHVYVLKNEAKSNGKYTLKVVMKGAGGMNSAGDILIKKRD